MVFLILCEESDRSGPWLAAGLRRAGAETLVVGAGELSWALHTGYRLDDVDESLTVRLSGGRGWRSGDVTGVVNRLHDIRMPATPGVPAVDREYAQEELRAITLAWLSGLASTGIPFLGRPSPGGLSGPWRHRSEWAQLAAAAGLAHVPVRFGEQVPLDLFGASGALVVCGGVSGDRDPALDPALVRLAAIARADTLGIAFDRQGRVLAAEHLPDLRPSGPQGIARVLVALGAVRASELAEAT